MLERAFLEAGIDHVTVREPDPPFNGSVTAIGIQPVADRTQLRKLLSKLPLLR